MLPGLRLRISPLVVVTVVVLATSTPASAGAPGLHVDAVAPGLHVDPASPVAKAYALPLAIAGEAPGKVQSGSEPHLFGAGIVPSGEPPRRMLGRAVPAAYRVLEPGSGAGVLLMALVGAVVIACGIGGAVALSRRR